MSPQEQAKLELAEETGITDADLLDLIPGERLLLKDDSGSTWAVHTFTAVTSKRQLSLDWEHEYCKWTVPGKTARFGNRVSWLDSVLRATGHLGR